MLDCAVILKSIKDKHCVTMVRHSWFLFTAATLPIKVEAGMKWISYTSTTAYGLQSDVTHKSI